MAISNQSRAKAPHIPPSGVWVPAVTFFDPSTDTLDLASQKQYYAYLSTTGLAGLVILGTNAEAFLLTREERRILIATAREAVGPSYPLIAGCGAHSTAQVLELISDAYAAGADYALVLPAAYFGKASTPAVIENFFVHVAQKSPLPIVIYNFPGVCNGVDMDSELIARIAKRSRDVVGVKLTCGSVGKITRLAATFAPSEFAIFGGQSDFLIGGLAAGSAGCIAAFGNVFPKSIVRIYDLWMQGKVEEARVLHGKAALAESPVKAGIAAVKFASAAVGAARAAGIEGAGGNLAPRRPYEPLGEAAKEGIRSAMAEMAEIEASL
jgi:4-hydroxy-2-oxoglutarate aldolase